MSKVRIYGDVSGYVDIAVPDNAGTTTLNLDKIPQAASNGLVGIGTTNPTAAQLEVRRNDTYLAAFKRSNGVPHLVLHDETDANSKVLRFLGSAEYGFKIDRGTTASGADGFLWLQGDSNGNIGIGTPPVASRKLIVSGGSETRSDIQLTYNTLGNANSDGVQLGIQSQGAYIWNFETAANTGDIYFGTANTRKMTLTTSGNLGIGTADPYTNLEISSQDPILRFNDSNGGTDTKNFEIRYVGTTNPDIDGLYFRGVNDANSVYSNKMVIMTNGNVGIGNDNPNRSLEIQGDTPALRIHANNENISPNPKIELMRGTSNTFGGDAYTDWRIEVQNNARFYITSDDTTRGENVRLIINHDTGNVNIGTDISPGYKLNVQGDLRATGTIYTNTDDIRGEGAYTGLLVGDISGSYASGYGYVELHAQDSKWNQLLHYHGGTGSGSNMWRVGSYYNSSSGDNYYRFYGRGNTNKNMLKLDAANDKIELESPMVRKTTILGSQTAPVNAGPWEHVTSWAVSGATATPINFNDVFNNNLFTQYKIHIHHWMSNTDNDEVYIRLLTGTNTAWTLNYHYVALHHWDFSGTHSTTTYSSTSEARIWEGNWYQASGYGGISGEMTIDNVSSATVAGVNIDRGGGAYRPNLRSDMVGYNVGGTGGTNSYRRTLGYTRFNVGNSSSYWKGFQIYNSSNNNVLGGSAISVYGLKAPT